MEAEQVKMPEILLSIVRGIWVFNKCSLDCKHLVNFQRSGKLILNNFASVLIAFMKEQIFGGPYIDILKMFSLSILNLFVF